MARLDSNATKMGDLKKGDTIMRFGRPWRRIAFVQPTYDKHLVVGFRYVNSSNAAHGNVVQWFGSTDTPCA